MSNPVKTLFDLVQANPAAYQLDTNRYSSARKISIPGAAWQRSTVPNAVIYQVSQPYKGSGSKAYTLRAVVMRHDNQADVWMGCTCPDWLDSGGWCMTPPRLCKHLIAWSQKMDLPAINTTFVPVATNPVDGTPSEDEPLPPLPFPDMVKLSVDRAVRELADQIWGITQSGAVPFLVGPTGCGKTSANRLMAIEHGMLFVEHAGSDAWTESDLVGIVHTNGQKFPGPIATACEWASEGRQVHLLLDEFPRNNRRVQDGLMRFLLNTPGNIALAMGVPCDGHDIHITSAPFWGEAWARAEDVTICLAGNPWGTDLDPALIRRTEPVRVDFDHRVADHFSPRIRTAIQASWEAVRQGNMALPIEYQAMTRAAGPDDLALVATYVSRLSFLDPAGADGFVSTLEGLSVGVTRSDLQAALPVGRGLGLPLADASIPF
ncbi:MAG: AAA family ATPase [Anaerolineales bacterium]